MERKKEKSLLVKNETRHFIEVRKKEKMFLCAAQKEGKKEKDDYERILINSTSDENCSES